MPARMLARIVFVIVFALVFSCTRVAHADDVEDVLWDLSHRGRSWIDVRGFARTNALAAVPSEIGVLGEIGLAWDTPGAARGRDAPPTSGVVRVLEANAVANGIVSLPVTPRVARAAVNAAFRTARLLPEHEIDSLSSRARWSGLVPEVRVRAARVWDESARIDTLPSDALRTTDAARANLLVEARASFRLDRLVFADEELTTWRLRIEQSEVAQKLALRVVASLAAWQRAWVEARSAPTGSVAALEASLRLSELEASLDVMTGGWFASWRGKEIR